MLSAFEFAFAGNFIISGFVFLCLRESILFTRIPQYNVSNHPMKLHIGQRQIGSVGVRALACLRCKHNRLTDGIHKDNVTGAGRFRLKPVHQQVVLTVGVQPSGCLMPI